MQFYRRNIDETIRERERAVAEQGGSEEARLSLLQARIRSGFTNIPEVERAAMLGHPIALRLLERDSPTLDELLDYLATQNKSLNMMVCLHICRNVYPIYNQFMVRGSSESSEERALDEVDEDYRHHIAYLVREPSRAINQIENYVMDTSLKRHLNGSCVLLGQIVEVVAESVEGASNAQQTLWDPSRAGLLSLTAIHHAVCACIARKKNQWIDESQACLRASIAATRSYVGCNESTALMRVSAVVTNGLFDNLC